MISAKLVHLIETNSDRIIDRVAAQLLADPVAGDRTFVDLEFRELAQELLARLGHWITTGDEEELRRRAEVVGALCFDRETPLHRAVRALCLLREKMLDFAEEHMVSFSSVELYSEEQLNRRMSQFFDLLAVHLVLGYERAMHGALFAPSMAH